MKRQKNTEQMKEQTRSTEVQINDEEIGKLCEKEFRLMIVKMLQRVENKMEKMKETIDHVNTITKEIEETKNKQTEVNNTITEIKATPEGTNSRITEAENWISELEDIMV